ncbi:MAG: hypothetical protein DRG55_01710 [Deltaproteobacteria bacterium]|nr:MAG: hypothetical protein DRG55_01710 [Deltaproteobacteria bacterium]
MTSRKKRLSLRYVGHIAFLTGKSREAVELDETEDISDLIARLDERYPGLKDLFMPKGGVFNSRTGILVRRAGQPTFSVIDEGERVEDGDIITLW